MTLGSLASQTCEFGSLVADGRSDTAPMEPVGTLHDSIEIEIRSVSLGNRTAGTVVNHLRRTHGCTSLKIIDTHTVATAGDIIGVNSKLAQGIDGTLANLVLRQL